MKHTFTMLLMLVSLAISAQTPQQMLDRTVSAFKKGGSVTASYKLTGKQGNSSGTITMSGNKYRLLSREMKCWYDGATMWTYSVATGEVNITTPTAADLQMSNPYAASQDLKSNYNMWKAAGQIPGCYAIMMQPKKKSPIKSLYLYIDNKTSMLRNIHVKMNDGNAYTITLTNYKTGVSVNASTFTFDKSQVPKGTEVVDLR